MSQGIDKGKFNRHLYSRSPFLEFCCLNIKEFDTSDFLGRMMHATIRESVDAAEKMSGVRIIKTHLPFELLPPNLLRTTKGR
jgi:hypothetical protein